jgi:NADH-quinone oxidoreductase subunit D
MEMIESIKIVRWCLGSIAPGPVIAEIPKTLRVPNGEAYVGIENPRGELGHYVGLGRRQDRRSAAACADRRSRTSAVLEELMPGALIADTIAIIGSTDIVVGETDR